MNYVKKRAALPMLFILLGAFILRVFALYWDQGYHLHPDERMLILVASKIHFFDQMNPDFFNYGSFPIYLLAGLAQLFDRVVHTSYLSYDGLLGLGRVLSATADIWTLLMIIKITRKLWNNTVSLGAALIYAVAFFPIQNSHFFVVDVYLTAIITTLAYCGIRYLEKPTYFNTILMGICTGLAIATKVTAVLFAVPIVALIIYNNHEKYTRESIGEIVKKLLLFGYTTLMLHLLTMPYAYLNYERFLADILLQAKMNSNAYVFPYTLQYVNTIPYVYYLKNIFLWGLGPLISILTIIGAFLIIQKRNSKHRLIFLLFLGLFYGVYFVIIGRSAVKFMRYMLPLYPFFAVLAGYALTQIMEWKKSIAALVIVGISIWCVMFMMIYTKPNTRVQATDWINKNIPDFATLAIEHWDDRLPITMNHQYAFNELAIYELPDNESKWNVLRNTVRTSDYIILASNRLYTPLQKLSDCTKFTSCYPEAAKYYQDLFSGKLGFEKVAEFTNYPRLEISRLKLQIPDDSADESFTVYDHPKVLIFKKK